MHDPQSPPRRRPHRLPAGAYTHPHDSYFFTLCARHQGRPFTITELADAVVASLLWTRDRYGWAVYAYCLMPDHLHFLCRPRVPVRKTVNGGARGELPDGLLEHVARFKSYTTQKAWPLGLSGQLWQRSSYDRIFDDQRPTEEVARYILDNPVRKGLVPVWTEWPYSGIPDPW